MTTATIATAENQRGRNHSYTMLRSAAENALTWLEESFANSQQPTALVEELTDALSYARCHGDNPLPTTATTNYPKCSNCELQLTAQPPSDGKCPNCRTLLPTTATESREREHTPTPWRLTGNSIVSEVAWLIPPSDDEEGIPLSVVDLTGAMGGENGDAQFIVTACNTYDHQQQLIEQMREALRGVQAHYQNNQRGSTFAMLEAVAAALAAAEGEGER